MKGQPTAHVIIIFQSYIDLSGLPVVDIHQQTRKYPPWKFCDIGCAMVPGLMGCNNNSEPE